MVFSCRGCDFMQFIQTDNFLFYRKHCPPSWVEEYENTFCFLFLFPPLNPQRRGEKFYPALTNVS